MTTKSFKKGLPRTFPAYVINLLFLIGLISAIAFRSIIVLAHIDQNLIRTVWYIGMFGYILFFSYRYYVAHKRRKVIADYKLIEKIDAGSPLTEDEKQATKFLLSSLMKSRESFNYLAIFTLSVLAVSVDLIILYFKR